MKIYDRIAAAFVWIAAFCLAAGVFLSLTLLLRNLPPTAPVAVGLVTIERYSKLRDYLGAALFFLLVPPLTVFLQRFLRRRPHPLATVTYLFSPHYYQTTGKVGGILGIPIARSFGLTNL